MLSLRKSYDSFQQIGSSLWPLKQLYLQISIPRVFQDNQHRGSFFRYKIRYKHISIDAEVVFSHIPFHL